MKFKIGVMVDSFRLGIREGLKKAKEVGADGVQIYAVRGEMDPDNLNKQSRHDLFQYIKDQGLVVSALCGDLGSPGFANAELNPARIEKSKRIVDLACELETSVITTHIGVVPQNQSSKRFKIFQAACNEIGGYAEKMGCHFAIETGPERSSTLRSFLDTLETTGVGVNFDPANLAMVIGEDAAEAVANLGPYIVHTHAKDGIQYKPIDPELVYDPEKLSASPEVQLPDYFREVPLGEGQVNWPQYLNALQKEGFSGFLTIEREVGENPEGDIRQAIEFLKEMLT
jgi:sugar phosphate isomerase/epimerase